MSPRRRLGSIAAATMVLVGVLTQDASAATHTWAGPTNGSWSVGANWTGGVPTTGEPGGTTVTIASGTTSIMDIPGLVVDQLNLNGSGRTINGAALGVSGSVALTNISSSGANTINAPLTLSGQTIFVNSSS